MINSVTVNNDNTLILLSTDIGFRLIKLTNLKSIFDLTFSSRKIKKAFLYKKSNLIFFIEVASPKKIIVFDVEKEIQVEKLEYNTAILDFMLLEKYLYAHTSDGLIIIHNLDNFERIHIEKNIFDFKDFRFDVPSKNETFFGYNTENNGDLKIVNFITNDKSTINIHKDRITLFKFSSDGQYVASLSKGTLLKLISIEDNSKGLKREFWLNYSNVGISDLSFSIDNQFIAINEHEGDVNLVYLLNSDIGRERFTRGKTFLSKFIKEKAFIKISKLYKNSYSIFDKDNLLYVFNKEGDIKKFKIFVDKTKAELIDETKLILPYKKSI